MSTIKSRTVVRFLVTCAAIIPHCYFIITRHNLGTIYVRQSRVKIGGASKRVSKDGTTRTSIPCVGYSYNQGKQNLPGAQRNSALDIDWRPAPIKLMQRGRHSVIETQAPPRLPCAPASFVKWYYRFSALNLTFILIKYIIICVLPDRFLDLKTINLDCVLLGRNVISPRSLGAARYLSLGLMIYHAAWKVFMITTPDRFHFDGIKFILCDQNEVIEKEHQSNRELEEYQNGDSRENGNGSKIESELRSRFSPLANPMSHHKFDSLFFFVNPFKQSGNEPFLYRPSRTSECHSRLDKLTIAHFVMCAITMLPVYLFFLYSTLSVSLTRAGFALNHAQCVAWIQKHSDPSKYNHIYKVKTSCSPNTTTPEELRQANPILLPLVDFNEFNAYHVTNLILDLLDCHFIWGDTFAMVSCCTYLVIITSLDALIYSKIVSKMLTNISDQLKEPPNFEKSRPALGLTISNRDNKVAIFSNGPDALYRAQALVVDLLRQIKAGNGYNSYFSLFAISMWWLYSVLLCFTIINPSTMSKMTRAEWLSIHYVSTMFLVMCLGLLATLTESNIHIYKLMSRIMALDRHYHSTKLRWAAIMKHYRPRPLHCFAIFSSVEPSWLFLFKLVAANASAILILSNLYQTYEDLNTVSVFTSYFKGGGSIKDDRLGLL